MDKSTSQQRSEVIEAFINIEWIMNAIISQHYLKKVIRPFILEVLYDPYFSFALRRNVLKKAVIDIDGRKIEDLNRLNSIRNYFAHCNQEFFHGADLPQPGSEGVVPDPKRPDQALDFTALYNEFMQKQGPITVYLAQILKDKGGEIFPAREVDESGT